MSYYFWYLCTFSTLTPLVTVIPRSEAGAAMVPVSWTEMQCPISTSKEGRKVLAYISNARHDNKMAAVLVLCYARFFAVAKSLNERTQFSRWPRWCRSSWPGRRCLESWWNEAFNKLFPKHFPCIPFFSTNIEWRAQKVVSTSDQADHDKWMDDFASF